MDSIDPIAAERERIKQHSQHTHVQAIDAPGVLTENVLAAYKEAAKNSLITGSMLRQMMGPEPAKESYAERIEAAKNLAEIGRIVREEMEAGNLTASTESVDLDFEDYVKDYARKRTQSLPREDQLMEGSGEPFTPPVSTEDVAGL